MCTSKKPAQACTSRVDNPLISDPGFLYSVLKSEKCKNVFYKNIVKECKVPSVQPVLPLLIGFDRCPQKPYQTLSFPIITVKIPSHLIVKTKKTSLWRQRAVAKTCKATLPSETSDRESEGSAALGCGHSFRNFGKAVSR